MGMVDLLRRIVRQQLVQIGGKVPNLTGGVAGESPALQAEATQTWLWTRMAGRGLPSLDEFYAQVTTAGVDSREVTAGDPAPGTVTVYMPYDTVQMLRGLVQVPTATTVSLGVLTNSSQADVVIYLDGVVQRRGNDALEVPLSMDKGDHVIEVLAYTKTLALALPPTLHVSATMERLERPRWKDITPGYLDPQNGLTATKLTWFNDLRAGGWRLMRREQEPLGVITALGEANAQGEFGVTWAGNVAALLARGEEVCAGTDTMGTVLSADYVPNPTNGTDDPLKNLYYGDTTARVRLDVLRTEVNLDWKGRPSGVGRFQELTRVTRTGSQGTVTWPDAQVRAGKVYEYRLQAFGLLNPATVSPWSETRSIRAGDILPPGAIAFLDGYPRVEGQRVYVRYHTPADEDYKGIKVYFDRVESYGTVSSSTSTTMTDDDNVWVPSAYKYDSTASSGPDTPTSTRYLLSVYGLPDPDVDLETQLSQVPSQTFLITDNGTNSVTFENPASAAAPVVGHLYAIRTTTAILTDLGAPDHDDDSSFDLVMDPSSPDVTALGDYVFASFDYAGNEQTDDAARWSPYDDQSKSGLPNPEFGPMTGEHDAADNPDIDTDGQCYLPIEFNGGCKEVVIFAAESPTTPVPTPALNSNRQSAPITRAFGRVGQRPVYRMIHKIGTTPGYYRRIIAYGVGWDGITRSDPVVLETKADAASARPIAPTDLTVTFVSPTKPGPFGFPMPNPDFPGFSLTWTTTNTTSTTFIVRDDVVIHEAAPGVTTWTDGGIPFTVLAQQGIPKYQVQHFENRRVSAFCGEGGSTPPPPPPPPPEDNSLQVLPLNWVDPAPYTDTTFYDAAYPNAGKVVCEWQDVQTHDPSDLITYTIYMSTGNGTNQFTVVGTIGPAAVVSPNTFSSSILGLKGDVRQFYATTTIRKTNPDGTISQGVSPILTGYSIRTASFGGGSITAPVLSLTQQDDLDPVTLRFSWTGGTGATSFDLYATTDSTLGTMALAASGVTSPYDFQTAMGVKQYYKVVAVNGSITADSNVISYKPFVTGGTGGGGTGGGGTVTYTQPDITSISQVADDVGIDGFALEVFWAQVSGATKYTLYGRVGTDPYAILQDDMDPGYAGYHDTNVEYGLKYWYYVVATMPDGTTVTGSASYYKPFFGG